jgi:hypothetical protein
MLYTVIRKKYQILLKLNFSKGFNTIVLSWCRGYFTAINVYVHL